MLTKCPICDSIRTKIIRKNLRHDIKRNVLQCLRCSFVFLVPVAKDLNFYKGAQYRKRYGPNLNKYSNPKKLFETYYPFQKYIVSELNGILNPKMNVLDIGCSTGHFLEALKGRVKERIGLELNLREAKFAKANLGLKIYTEPLEMTEIKEAPFDLITVLQALEHIENPLKFLETIKKFLKPEGFLYIEVPNIKDALISAYHLEAYEDFYYREAHVSYFSEKTLKTLLNKAGFKGKCKTIQRYNIINHLNWILNKRPQDDFKMGNGPPLLVSDNFADKKIRTELNNFIESVDRKYKKLLERNSLGENIAFLGNTIN